MFLRLELQQTFSYQWVLVNNDQIIEPTKFEL
jgi:hypothetical protein